MIQYELDKDFDDFALSSLEPKRSRLRNHHGTVAICISSSSRVPTMQSS
jgi:hypothetical protein